IAGQEEEESSQGNIGLESKADHRSKAREIREEIAETLVKKSKSDEYLTKQWWFLATIAEAYFGLKRYDEARRWLKEAAQLKETAEWERESTVRQLAQLARMLDERTSAPDKEQESEAWQALLEPLKELYSKGPEDKAAEYKAKAACASAFT